MLFFEDFTSPFSTPDLQFTVTIRLRDINSNHNNADVVVEHTGEPTGHIQTFENTGDSSTHDKQNANTRVLRSRKRGRKSTNNDSANKIMPFWKICPIQQMIHYHSLNI